MPDIEIVKLKLRRGTDAQRQVVTLEQGELGYTTDAKRVWVGDGFTIGGVNVGNVAHTPMTVGTRTDLTYAINGDLVYDNNLLYQLSGTYADNLSSWAFIGSRTDNATIEYNASNQLHIVNNGVGIDQLNSTVVDISGGLAYGANGLSARIDNSTITINDSGELTVTNTAISAGDIGLGLSGGNGDPIGVNTTSSFTFDGSLLEFANAPANTVPAEALQAGTIGTGLTNSGGTLRLETIGGATINPFNTAEYDSTGRVISTSTTISQNISGTGGGNIYFGSLYADAPGCESTIQVLSANVCGTSVTAHLSSAGFVKIASGTCGNFAIPVFKLPY